MPPTTAGEDWEESATVLEVVDGDTLRVRLDDGRVESVRLIGIDAPERGDALSAQAATALAQLVAGRRISMTRDVSERDRFDRLLRYVWVGDTLVNAELVRRGLAEARRYPPDVMLASVLEQAQAEAVRDGVGMWESGQPPAPITTLAAGDGDPACDPAYPDLCIPSPPPDLDCSDIPHRRFRVLPPDPHQFDGNRDGIGCEGR
jgi:micrococcal nuclease